MRLGLSLVVQRIEITLSLIHIAPFKISALEPNSRGLFFWITSRDKHSCATHVSEDDQGAKIIWEH